MNLPSYLKNRLCLFLNEHEMSSVLGTECPFCVNYRFLKILDQDIDHNLIKNYCKSDKDIVDKIPFKKLTSKSQRIHVIGNHWPLINSLKHRKFVFLCKSMNYSNKDSICITDINTHVGKLNNKLIITQGYNIDYDLESIDYVLIEKKYIKNDSASFQQQIPEKGFLVIDLNHNEKFYSV